MLLAKMLHVRLFPLSKVLRFSVKSKVSLTERLQLHKSQTTRPYFSFISVCIELISRKTVPFSEPIMYANIVLSRRGYCLYVVPWWEWILHEKQNNKQTAESKTGSALLSQMEFLITCVIQKYCKLFRTQEVQVFQLVFSGKLAKFGNKSFVRN